MAHARPKILIAVLAAAAFLPFLGRRDIVTSHEARVVQTARRMAQAGWPWSASPAVVPAVQLGFVTEDSGKDLRLIPDPAGPPLSVNPWLVPVLNDEIRLQKPPLPYWCCAMLFRIAGHWSEGLARLIPALLGALSAWLIYDLARRTLGLRAAAPAAFAWLTSYFIPDEFRKAMADPYLAFFALAAIWAWVFASTAPPAAPRRRHVGLLSFYLATALGLLSKGPPLFVHTLIPIILFHVLHRRRPPRDILAHLAGLTLLAAIVLPWPIYVINHVPHALEIWRYESVGEMADNSIKGSPFWSYGPRIFQLALPWTPLLLYAAYVIIRRRRQRAPTPPPPAPSPGTPGEGWGEGPANIPNNVSIPNYVSAPTFPRLKAHPNPPRLFPLLWYLAIVCFFSFVHMKKNAYLLPAMPAQTLMIAQGLVWASATLRKRRRWPRRRFDELLAATATAIVIALTALFNLILTPEENLRSPRPACRFIQLQLATDPQATLIPAKLPPEARLYLPDNLAFNPDAQTLLYLLDDPKGESPTDRDAFAARLPDLDIGAIVRVMIPGETNRHRYKLFRLSIGAGAPKNVARASSLAMPQKGVILSAAKDLASKARTAPLASASKLAR